MQSSAKIPRKFELIARQAYRLSHTKNKQKCAKSFKVHFTARFVNICNGLPNKVIDINSVDLFK